MSKIKLVEDYIDPTSPFKLRYRYEIDVNIDLDNIQVEYRDFIFEQLLSEFELELGRKIYNKNIL